MLANKTKQGVAFGDEARSGHIVKWEVVKSSHTFVSHFGMQKFNLFRLCWGSDILEIQIFPSWILEKLSQ